MTEETITRLDKWLWYARFFKTRTQATKLIQSGKLRINGDITNKPHRTAIIGMVLTFPQAKHVRVIKILEIGHRRGPAPEAISLYEDLSPIMSESNKQDKNKDVDFERREIGTGRPTKKQRRETEQLKDSFVP
ncbi:MAG: RNA-binding S4 domain-containing protein [Alphaproteobacteria bacterium]